MATYETVRGRREGRVGYLTLNRPGPFNAVNAQLEADLLAAAQEFDQDDDARIALRHGAGESCCAGADVKRRFHRGREARLRKMTRGLLGPRRQLEAGRRRRPRLCLRRGVFHRRRMRPQCRLGRCAGRYYRDQAGHSRRTSVGQAAVLYG